MPAVSLAAQPLITLLYCLWTPGTASPPPPRPLHLLCISPPPHHCLQPSSEALSLGMHSRTRPGWNSFPVLLSHGGEDDGFVAASPPHCTARHPGRSPLPPGSSPEGRAMPSSWSWPLEAPAQPQGVFPEWSCHQSSKGRKIRKAGVGRSGFLEVEGLSAGGGGRRRGEDSIPGLSRQTLSPVPVSGPS